MYIACTIRHEKNRFFPNFTFSLTSSCIFGLKMYIDTKNTIVVSRYFKSVSEPNPMNVDISVKIYTIPTGIPFPRVAANIAIPKWSHISFHLIIKSYH